MNSPALPLVRYREQQVLTADDLRAEQAYRTALRHWHLNHSHRWGIVQGLALQSRPLGIFLTAGLAVDGYGRELIVPEDVLLPLGQESGSENAFDALESEALSIWLVYSLSPVTPTRTGRGYPASGQNTRWREEALLRLRPARQDENPRRPDEVPDDQLDSLAQDLYPTPEDEWPVFLGKVTRNGATVQATRPFHVEAGLVGEQISAPSGETSVQLGEYGTADLKRFIVSTRAGDQQLPSRLEIDNNGRIALHSNTYVADGDLQIADGREAARGSSGNTKTRAWGVNYRPRSEPTLAMPWQIYRSPVTDPQTEVKTDDLRIEFFNPGQKGDPRRYRVVVGTRDANGAFSPCLSIDASCLVTFHGDVRIEGQVIESPVVPDPNDPRFGGNIFANWQDAVTKGSDTLDNFYQLLDVKIKLPGPVIAGQKIAYTATVTNKATSPVRLLQLGSNVTLANQSFKVELLLAEQKLLAANQSMDFPGSELELPADSVNKRLVIGVGAYGLRSTQSVVAGLGSVEQTVQPPQNN